MGMRRRAVTAVLALALAGVPAACGEEDMDRGVDKATDEAGEAKKDVEKGAKTAGRELKDEAGEAKRDVEKEIED